MNDVAPRSRAEWKPLDYLLLTVIMTLMGGLYWGVRGAGGFGGETGGYHYCPTQSTEDTFCPGQ